MFLKFGKILQKFVSCYGQQLASAGSLFLAVIKAVDFLGDGSHHFLRDGRGIGILKDSLAIVSKNERGVMLTNCSQARLSSASRTLNNSVGWVIGISFITKGCSMRRPFVIPRNGSFLSHLCKLTLISR
ncbi:MAG: hypothetical protein M2R45_00236 [Verrucomicrobia subdivision 3 bacterium]|nr:hypothetical protein [Limisphaerales bacterium]MCS1412306.1 hypothetical protein [Limisphaerales bacterium]